METNGDVGAASMTVPEEQARKDAAWQAQMAEVDRKWAAHSARRAELMTVNKAALFTALVAGGITSVVVTFDGSGDSGQIEEVTAFSGENELSDFPTEGIEHLEIGFEAAEPTVTMTPIATVVESLAYGLLSQSHGGWENDDGAYGDFTFDAAAQCITLDFNERYTATTVYSHEF